MNLNKINAKKLHVHYGSNVYQIFHYYYYYFKILLWTCNELLKHDIDVNNKTIFIKLSIDIPIKPPNIKAYFKYVNDIFILLKGKYRQADVNSLNKTNKNIIFTLETNR